MGNEPMMDERRRNQIRAQVECWRDDTVARAVALELLEELDRRAPVVPEGAQPAVAKHCDTCICGRRAPVQAERDPARPPKGPGSISWQEHLETWSMYAARYGTYQSAERLAERGGFGFHEAEELLGRPLKTWEPRR